jgi:hypothetical protein
LAVGDLLYVALSGVVGSLRRQGISVVGLPHLRQGLSETKHEISCR